MKTICAFILVALVAMGCHKESPELQANTLEMIDMESTSPRGRPVITLSYKMINCDARETERIILTVLDELGVEARVLEESVSLLRDTEKRLEELGADIRPTALENLIMVRGIRSPIFITVNNFSERSKLDFGFYYYSDKKRTVIVNTLSSGQKRIILDFSEIMSDELSDKARCLAKIEYPAG